MRRASETVLTLRIDRDSTPISGRIEDERGVEREFTGWLGLARALEVLLNATTAAADDAT